MDPHLNYSSPVKDLLIRCDPDHSHPHLSTASPSPDYPLLLSTDLQKQKDSWNIKPKNILESFQMTEFIEELKDEFLPNRQALVRTPAVKVLHYTPQEEEGFAIMSVTIRPRQYWDVGMFVAVIYSYVPHTLIPWFLYKITFCNDLFSFEGIVLMSLVASVNDIGIKRIYKQPRPITSRAHGYGMPSSHCACSYATMLWAIYEIWFGEAGLWHPKIPLDHVPMVLQEALKPLGAIDALFHSIVMLFLFFPMPWARVKVGDHTVKQSVTGALVGLAVGLFYCLAVLEGGAEWWLTREWFKEALKQIKSETLAKTLNV